MENEVVEDRDFSLGDRTYPPLFSPSSSLNSIACEIVESRGAVGGRP